MFPTIPNIILFLGLLFLWREVRNLNKIVDARGRLPPAEAPDEPAKTTTEEVRDAVRSHEDKYHRRN